MDDLSAIVLHGDKIVDAKEKSRYAAFLVEDDCVFIVHAWKFFVHD